MADAITLNASNAVVLPSPFTRFAAAPSRTKIMFGAGLAALIALVVAASTWSSRPDYKVLYANLADRDGGAVIAALAQLNIPYRSEGGNVILVPSDKVHDARFKLAAQGLPKGGIVGLELLDNQKMGATQFQEQVNFQRGLEGELARSIQTLSAVQGARVHLAIPKPSVFLREQQKPTASVIVNLYPGKSLDPSQLAGILHLVASSVPELMTKNVSVLDQNGTLISKNDDAGNNGLDPGQLEYVKRLEQQVQTRIATILEPILGPDNYRVQVNADVDFTQSEQSSESFRPNGDTTSAALRSQQISESSTKGGAEGGGVPGALTNQPAATPTAPVGQAQAQPGGGVGTSQAATAATDSHKESIVNYEVDKTTKVVHGATGMIKRLSAAVVVNHRVTKDTDGNSSSTPLTEQEIAQINGLVREAMGFSKDRGDSLNVSNVPFSVPEKIEPVDIPLWKDPAMLSNGAEIGKWVALVIAALIVVRGFIKPALDAMRPDPAAAGSIEVNSAGVQRLSTSVGPDAAEIAALPSPTAVSIEQARELARSDPRAVANVVKQWVANE